MTSNRTSLELKRMCRWEVSAEENASNRTSLELKLGKSLRRCLVTLLTSNRTSLELKLDKINALFKIRKSRF